MHARLATGKLTVAAILAGCALVPAAADAALPKSGSYAGKTTQPDSIAYAGPIKLAVSKSGGRYKLTKLTTRMKLDCQGDPARLQTLRLTIPADAGRVSGLGRFKYRISTTPTSGFSVTGRFVSRTKAKGSFGFSDADTGCYVGDVKWTASLR